MMRTDGDADGAARRGVRSARGLLAAGLVGRRRHVARALMLDDDRRRRAAAAERLTGTTRQPLDHRLGGRALTRRIDRDGGGIEDSLRRVPPQSLEAEESVLGGILLDNTALDRVARGRCGPTTSTARRTARSSAPCSSSPSAASRST